MEDIGSLIALIVYLAVLIFLLAAFWKMFTKAGEPGIMAIIPIVNIFFLVKIAGKEWWWIILFFIPLVNIVAAFLVWKGIAENFGHGIGFALGLFFLSPIFVPILAFGDSRYIGGRKQKYSY
ncbi:MAG: DUF5684 domain-containing protein [Chloroflexota bacterium]